MFSPNCVVVLANPEITIKSSVVRSRILKRLESNIIFYLKLKKLSFSKLTHLAGRFFIETSQPEKIILALNNCFGIFSLALAQKVKANNIEEICFPVKDICLNNLESTFAVRGKNYSPSFSSKDLEIALGSEVLKCFPELKVKLKCPISELFCFSFEGFCYFYFKEILGSCGMPVGSQGKVALIASTKNADALALSLMKVGCSLVVFGKLSKSAIEFSPVPISFVELNSIKKFYNFGKIEAVFSDSVSRKEIDSFSKKLGFKIFAPFIF